MDRVQNLSGFDRRLVSVPGVCPKECPARQMYGRSLCRDEVLEISYHLEREHRRKEAGGLRKTYMRLLASLKAAEDENRSGAGRETFTCPEGSRHALKETASFFAKTAAKLKGG